MQRLITQKQKIIDALKNAAPDGVTNSDLAKISLRYGGHLGILYSQGYKIKKQELDGGLVKYFLMSEPSQTYYFNNAQEEILADIYFKHDDAISSEELKSLLDEKHFHIIRKNGWYQNYYGAENSLQID